MDVGGDPDHRMHGVLVVFEFSYLHMVPMVEHLTSPEDMRVHARVFSIGDGDDPHTRGHDA